MYSTLLLQLRAKATNEPKEPEYICKKCGGKMIKRQDKYRKGKYWFGCSNYPKCEHTVKDSEIKFKKWANKSAKMF